MNLRLHANVVNVAATHSQMSPSYTRLFQSLAFPAWVNLLLHRSRSCPTFVPSLVLLRKHHLSPDSVTAQQFSVLHKENKLKSIFLPSPSRSFLPIFTPSPTSPSTHNLIQYSYFRRTFMSARVHLHHFQHGRDLHLLLQPSPTPPPSSG